MRGRGMDLSAPVEECMTGCCKYGDEFHSFINRYDFFVQLKYQPLKKDCTTWSQLVCLFYGWLVSQLADCQLLCKKKLEYRFHY